LLQPIEHLNITPHSIMYVSYLFQQHVLQYIYIHVVIRS